VLRTLGLGECGSGGEGVFLHLGEARLRVLRVLCLRGHGVVKGPSYTVVVGGSWWEHRFGFAGVW
jgi:hypothetical protein